MDSLNRFLDTSHPALGLYDPLINERNARWYVDLRFIQLGGGDINRGALDGIPVRKTGQRVDLAISVELDRGWPMVVTQAARSAQILCSGCNLRKPGVVTGFRSTTIGLRFSIIHRGGSVTASDLLSVFEERGTEGVCVSFFPG